MNTTQCLSNNFLLHLYEGQTHNWLNPVLQILGFEVSETDSKEIIVRLSDGQHFIDCPLVGPYHIQERAIISFASTLGGRNQCRYLKNDVVTITDYFHKIEDERICRLKIMVRKIVQTGRLGFKVGHPQEISQYVQAKNEPYNQQKYSRIDFKIQPKENIDLSNNIRVKIDEPSYSEMSRESKMETIQRHSINEPKNFSYIPEHDPDEPLTAREIALGHDGFFIGRLVRMKAIQKQNKDGPILLLYLGFLDSNKEVVRINLIGRVATKEEKLLKKGRCYYVRGLQISQRKGVCSFIKLQEKDYKLHEICNQTIVSRYDSEYYHWEHENEHIEHENVDVFGVVEDIEEKTVYGQRISKGGENSKEMKEVIRIVVRNKFKTVKISFWSDQMKTLEQLNLKKGEVVIIEDLKKKKTIFLDYSSEANLVRVTTNSELYKRFQDMLPSYLPLPLPKNLAQIHYQRKLDKYSPKIYIAKVQLTRIYDDKMLIKVCELCKKKINIHSVKCFDCNSNAVAIHYNVCIEMHDYSGGINVIGFDPIVEKFFGHSPCEFKEIYDDKQQLEQFLDRFSYENYEIGVEFKNQRYLLRHIESIPSEKWKSLVESNCREIAQLMHLTNTAVKLQPESDREI